MCATSAEGHAAEKGTHTCATRMSAMSAVRWLGDVAGAAGSLPLNVDRNTAGAAAASANTTLATASLTSIRCVAELAPAPAPPPAPGGCCKATDCSSSASNNSHSAGSPPRCGSHTLLMPSASKLPAGAAAGESVETARWAVGVDLSSATSCGARRDGSSANTPGAVSASFACVGTTRSAFVPSQLRPGVPARECWTVDRRVLDGGQASVGRWTGRDSSG